MMKSLDNFRERIFLFLVVKKWENADSLHFARLSNKDFILITHLWH